MSATESELLKNWYLRFIDLFRQEYQKLANEEKEVIQNYDNFLSPCQIEVFWLKEPSFQLIVRSNFKERPDKEVTVNGPFDSHEFIEKVDLLIKQPKWQSKVKHDELEGLPYDHERTYAEDLARALNALVYYAKEYKFTSHPHDGEHGSYGIGDNVWVYTFKGNKAQSNHADEVNKFIKQIKDNAIGHAQYLKDKAEGKFSQPYEYKPMGYGVYLLPPIVVGRKPRFTPSEILMGRTVPFTGYEKGFHAYFNDLLIIVQKDGFLYVANPDKKIALKVLNTIMAVALMKGLELSAVREHELSDAGYNKETLELGSFTWNTNTLRSVFFEERFGRAILRDIKRKEIEENYLKEIIQDAAKVFKNENLADELRIFGEATTHISESEFGQAFLFGWLIIERHIAKLYSNIAKLEHDQYPFVDRMLRDLNSKKILSKKEYDEFVELKEIRNKFAHSGFPVVKQDAERCITIAKQITLQKFNEFMKVGSLE